MLAPPAAPPPPPPKSPPAVLLEEPKVLVVAPKPPNEAVSHRCFSWLKTWPGREEGTELKLDIPVLGAAVLLLLPKPPKPVLPVFVLVLEPKPPKPPPNDMVAVFAGQTGRNV